jgi:O-antigen/teichoic acid export membrane protein
MTADPRRRGGRTAVLSARPAVELSRLWSNSLIRNALQLMSTTAVTAGLGYAFWLVAARLVTPEELGLGAAITSVATAVSVSVHLGGGMLLVERLPRHEGTPGWWSRLVALSTVEVVATLVVAAAVVVALDDDGEFTRALSTPGSVALFLLGTCAWTGVNVLSYAFISLRRSGRGLLLHLAVSSVKLLALCLPAFSGRGGSVFTSWVLGATAGVLAGFLLLPWWWGRATRQGLIGSRPTVRRDVAASFFWHHLTSCSGVLVPLLLPVIVVLRISTADNAYFFTTWMVGGVFLTVSQSVSSSLFAEGSWSATEIRRKMLVALRLTAVILVVPVVVVLAAGGEILRVFGPGFAERGHLLLLTLVLAAVPDGLTSLAVAVLRVYRRVRTAAYLNLAMLVLTLAGAWLLLPRIGIAGAGLAFLIAQSLGALAVTPFLLSFRAEAAQA